MRTGWIPWLVGLAILLAVVGVALHVSETAAFARLLEQAQPAWLAAAFVLQALTYAAQAQIWRSVVRAAGKALPLGAAYALSLVKLLVDQALPSSGVSGSIVVAGALERRGIPDEVAMAGIVVSSAAYLLGYIVALGSGVAVMTAEDRATAPVVGMVTLFIVVASAVVALEIALSGKPVRPQVRGRLRRWLEPLERAAPTLSRNPALLARATALQLVIVALDCLTLWALLRALGTAAALGPVFSSFMISTLLRTVSIVPGGLGTFEAVLVMTLHQAGIAVAPALSATLLFRGLSFWLPMLPGAILARRVQRLRSRI